MFAMVGLDLVCACAAGAMVSSVILSRLGFTYSNFKSNRRRCSFEFLLSTFAWPNSNKDGLVLEKWKENHGGQTSTEKAYQSAGISTETAMVSLLLLIATVAASLTYQAGLNPPAGFWEEDSYDERTSLLFTAVLPIAFASCFILGLQHLVKIVSSVWFFNHCNSNARRHNTMCNWHEPVDRERSICTHSRESDPAAADEDDPSSRRPREQRWTVASAAEHHMTGNLAMLATGGYSHMSSDEVHIVHDASTGKSLRVLGCGSVRTETMALDDVWYVPGLDSNLVSTGQLARLGCAITLGPRGCRITRGDNALVGSARFVDGHRFELDFLKVPASSK